MQPTVPLWVAGVVLALISGIGFLLAVPPDPQITWLTPTVRVVLGTANAMLGAVALVLNIKRAGS